MLWATLLLIATIACLLLWDYLRRKQRNDALHYMPGPPALPILGNVLQYRGIGSEQIISFALENCRKYGRMYRVWIFNQLAVFSCDPRDVEVVLSSTEHIAKNNLYDIMLPWLGTGLLMSTGQKWHVRRKILTPTFHFKILEQFVDIFDRHSEVLVQRLQRHADGKSPFNVHPLVCRAALDMIAETAMGTKVNAQMHPDMPYAHAVIEVTNLLTVRSLKPWQRVDWVFRLLAPRLAKRQDELIRTLHDFTEAVIQERREQLTRDLSTPRRSNDACNELGQKRRMAMLDVLLQATVDGEPLSDEDIREEVDTFMFEGHDTTTSGITFCLYEISRHPCVQQCLLEEIHKVLGQNSDRAVTLRDLSELKYLECVVKESLRLHPPVPIIGRSLKQDVEIRGKLIPAGTSFTVGIFAMLRDPHEFYAPNEFRPERFASCDTAQSQQQQPQPHAFSNIAFSAGPRNCIGQKFAVLEMKSVISKVLQNYELLPLGPAPRPAVSLVLRSANGIHMGMRSRLHR
ncbi:hypothetical protein KR222_010998 [Zaprionus bogoriensis]|nr:hypothetical protein KR222_010998 [Zaprionus bogoriensis]